jgi:hypothetical protein
MNIHLENSVIKVGLLVGGVVLLLGSVLSAYNNAYSAIPPALTYVGSVLVLIIGIVAFFLVKAGKVTVSSESDKIRVFHWEIAAFVVAFLIILWIPRLGSYLRGKTYLVTRRQTVEIRLKEEEDIYYPYQFISMPELSVDTLGNGKLWKHQILEQRLDGFKIKVDDMYCGYEPCKIQWTATGTSNHP